MAITAPRVSTVTQAVSTSVNCTVSGLSAVAGELILIVAMSKIIADAPTTTPPTGYTLLHDSASNVRIHLFGKIAAGSDADVTANFAAAGSWNSTWAIAVPGALANISTVSDGASDASAWATNQIYPSLTPATSGACVIVFGGKVDLGWTSVVPISGYTELKDQAVGNGVSVFTDYLLNAGALTTSTKAVTGDATQVNFSIAISIKPATNTPTGNISGPLYGPFRGVI